eukprot:CAMPEP_0185699434 /NCGR_PEP_ID=MMETSP1164-20130828/6923_1 /TAXON_ID=1104430 /ORGANISM="Chrysoreinhardia sp, Strain CCMP2950" /LENGTH=53 /DNA_ID=CAMNT_0028366369 /DNA_START=66 /DNA_END=223 /DNA_ORIENTATION=+
MAAPAAPDFAFFYPNRLAALPVKVRGERVCASQDLLAASHEMRHFIDSAFLAT